MPKESQEWSTLRTNWPLVRDAGADDTDVRRAALDELITRYWPALKARLVGRLRIPRQDADDLLQEFLTEKVVERGLIGRADPEKGKFRTFLFTVLERFVSDHKRYMNAQKRCGGKLLPIDETKLSGAKHSEAKSDSSDVAWARITIIQSLHLMQRECVAGRKERIWKVFVRRLLFPLLYGTTPPSYETLVAEFSFDTPAQASNALVTGKRHYGRCLKSVIEDYSDSQEAVDDELRDLQNILAQADVPVIRVSEQTADEVDDLPHLSDIDSSRFTNLLELNDDCDYQWDDEELAALWQHQLRQTPQSICTADNSNWAADLPPEFHEVSFAAMFQRDGVPLDVLRKVKHWAKICAGDNSSVPKDVSMVLYYACISAALVRHEDSLTELSKDQLLAGLNRARDQRWLDTSTRSLIENAISRLI